jgi:hypothetical protein
MAHLNLWKQHLRVVPDAVWERVELETLVLADNGLTAVPNDLGRLNACGCSTSVTTRWWRCPRPSAISRGSRTSSTSTTTA